MALTKLNNQAVANITTLPVALGDMVLVSSATASSSASIEFSLGNYKEYQFFFVNMHPQNDNVRFQFNLSTDNGSTYAVTKTSTSFRQQHGEDDSSGVLQYDSAFHLAQDTAYQVLADSGNDNDQATSGYLQLFNPSSSVFVKHYIGTSDGSRWNDLQQQYFISGYGNTTSPVNSIKFQMNSGNIDSGTILMYGIN